jgi:hypothetical protein
MCVVKGGASSASSCGSSSSSSFSRCSAFSRAGAARRRRVTSRGSLCWPPALSNLGRCTSAAKKTSPTQTPTTSTSTPPNIRTVPSAANSSRAWCTCNRTCEPASPRAPFPSRPQITRAAIPSKRGQSCANVPGGRSRAAPASGASRQRARFPPPARAERRANHQAPPSTPREKSSCLGQQRADRKRCKGRSSRWTLRKQRRRSAKRERASRQIGV